MIAATAALVLTSAVPAQASAPGEAEKLRRLDIMLMVTGLRCRTTPSDFRADFAAFEAAHMADLNAAAAELRQGLVARAGAAGANRALDRISTGMANEYGQGHPWLDCAQLKQATRVLTRIKGRATLVEAANELLAPSAAPQLAFAGR
ncbi:S-adenosyl-L-homocysteine hydrolase [Novosphingobium bradum]|uniref:S-adenosyl-L-homocysteine hydrolase n=1 Tax=Novosphingobium bradum TaxID=1737444 RepID=A0ABV7IQZ2_9SPHN